MIYSKYFVLIFVMFFVNVSFAQRLKGVVVDNDSQPLEAAYVYNINAETHAHTSANGVFILDENKIGDSLKIGLLGYKNQLLILNQKNLENGITIKLEEKIFQLKEICFIKLIPWQTDPELMLH